jgi:hypothetical protein
MLFSLIISTYALLVTASSNTSSSSRRAVNLGTSVEGGLASPYGIYRRQRLGPGQTSQMGQGGQMSQGGQMGQASQAPLSSNDVDKLLMASENIKQAAQTTGGQTPMQQPPMKRQVGDQITAASSNDIDKLLMASENIKQAAQTTADQTTGQMPMQPSQMKRQIGGQSSGASSNDIDKLLMASENIKQAAQATTGVQTTGSMPMGQQQGTLGPLKRQFGQDTSGTSSTTGLSMNDLDKLLQASENIKQASRITSTSSVSQRSPQQPDFSSSETQKLNAIWSNLMEAMQNVQQGQDSSGQGQIQGLQQRAINIITLIQQFIFVFVQKIFVIIFKF